VSTVLESGDHALQITHRYFFTKLTSSSLSEQLKKVSCADTSFFCELRTKVRYFSHTTQQSTIDRPPKPCPMASESSDDGHKSHPTSSLMPPLASVALKAVNFAVGVTKQPPRQHEDGAMVGSCCSSAQDVLGRGDL
jgi:hypothetical protein